MNYPKQSIILRGMDRKTYPSDVSDEGWAYVAIIIICPALTQIAFIAAG